MRFSGGITAKTLQNIIKHNRTGQYRTIYLRGSIATKAHNLQNNSSVKKNRKLKDRILSFVEMSALLQEKHMKAYYITE